MQPQLIVAYALSSVSNAQLTPGYAQDGVDETREYKSDNDARMVGGGDYCRIVICIYKLTHLFPNGTIQKFFLI